MEGLKSILDEKDFRRRIFTASEYKNVVNCRAKRFVEKHFYKDFINIFDDLKTIAESGKAPFKNYSIYVPEELEISFASEMITVFLKSIGYAVNIDLSRKKDGSGDITLNIAFL